MTREYFKEKHSGEAYVRYTPCCKVEMDRPILNKNSKDDWEMIEEYCEDSLLHDSDIDYIEAVCCDVCGRLIEYKSVLANKKNY